MTEHPPLKTVADLKLPRYLGTWYEIARLPMRHEPEGCTDVSAHYTLLDNGNVGVTNRCRMDGEIEEATGEACAIDNDSARLEVSFLPKGLRWLLARQHRSGAWLGQSAGSYPMGYTALMLKAALASRRRPLWISP